ncbi:MAG TPA: YbaN family protein [Ottowia sp.]|uniref:YbaN family protein n=1 Tax=Ottowia sp. TaxID=1898956 RepID=UPI002D0C6D04|nr:YbaN family protein [Ottowia sp.]MCZ2089372.1 YbaN family protein [Burkholderiales bacterium]HNI84352.1 YbaN family protein [Ottowia sp.]HNJ45147.1 YbaN family protein [Ottowia sp.]HNK52626.1 YbaN family protein [Ottowia sp.]HNN33203.1 YbaN family protein [Ottowia sp.]
MPESDALQSHDEARMRLRRRVATLLWRALALLSLLLGGVGAMLPVLPTVPFLLLAAWAASKGWPALEIWLLNHRRLGPPLVQWRERGAVSRPSKWLSSIMMGGSAIGMQFLPQIPLALRLGAPAVMLAVAIWLWRRPEA